MTVYGMDGNFGGGKSSSVTYIASQAEPNTLIWSNIKMNKHAIKNYRYFNDGDFMKVLRTLNALNDIEREMYSTFNPKTGLNVHKMGKYTKHIIVLDEAAIVLNANQWRKVDEYMVTYINQQRKNFENIYICTADGAQTGTILRRFCELWMYPTTPYKNWPVLHNILEVRIQKRDPDTMAVITEKYLAKDSQGDDVVKERPIDFHYCWYWRPFVYHLYDHLHKNIIDPHKYEDIDVPILLEFVNEDPQRKAALEHIPKLNQKLYPENELLYLASDPKAGL